MDKLKELEVITHQTSILLYSKSIKASIARFLYQNWMVFFFVFSTLAERPIYTSVVLDYFSGRVLYSFKRNHRIRPASLTKMMTAFIIMQAVKNRRLKLTDQLIISSFANAQSPCKLPCATGDKLSILSALKCIMIISSNNIAVALAEKMCGRMRNFVHMMNTYAHRLGMKSTFFENSSGLPAERQYSTAFDMAILARALYKTFVGFEKVCTLKHIVFNGRKMANHNKIIGDIGDGIIIDGIKTGWIPSSGYNIAIRARCGNRKVIAVLIGGHSSSWRSNQMKAILRHVFLGKKDPGYIHPVRQIKHKRVKRKHV